jgi:sugar lactone lactonase YvrE
MEPMKTLLPALNLQPLPLACLALAACACLGAVAAQPPSQDVSAALQRMQGQLDQQNQRIERLYRALGPHLEELEARAAEAEKREREDKALAMERIADVEAQDFSLQGCMNPAAAQFAVITSTGRLRIYDEHGEAGKEFKAPGEVVTCAAFSPDGAALLAGTAKGALLVWDVATSRSAVAATQVGAAVGRVAWIGKDKLAWATNVNYWEGGKPANQDKPAGAVVERATGKVLWGFEANIIERYVTLAGSADGQRLLVMEIPGHTRGAFLLDGATGKVLQTCYDKEHGSGPLSLALSPDSRVLAVGYAPYDIILWDARTGEQLKLLKGHSNWVVSLAFSADGKRLISGAGDSTVRVWDIPSGKEIGRLRFGDSSSYTHAVGLSPKGDVAFALVEPGHLVVARVEPRLDPAHLPSRGIDTPTR